MATDREEDVSEEVRRVRALCCAIIARCDAAGVPSLAGRLIMRAETLEEVDEYIRAELGHTRIH